MGKKFLILGGTGFVGSYLVKFLQSHDQHRITATTTRDPRSFEFYHEQVNWYQIKFDQSYQDQLQDLLQKTQPDIIINAIAAESSSYRDQPDLADIVNHQVNQGIYNLLSTEYTSTKYYLLSTSYVFDNLPSAPNEDTSPDCSSVYGSTKLAGEKVAQQLNERCSIIRVTTVWGEKLLEFQHSNILLDVLDPIKREQMTIFDNVYRTPTIVNHVVKAIFDYITSDMYVPVLHLTHNQVQTFATWIKYLPQSIIDSVSFDSYNGENIPKIAGLTTKNPEFSVSLNTREYLQNLMRP